MIDIPHLSDDPYLPDIGEIYWVETTILHRHDKKPQRPVLVVSVPADMNGRVTVVTRTSDTSVPGVHDSANPSLGLYKDGVFSSVRTAEAGLWTPSNVQYMGVVESELIARVIKEFNL